MTLVVTHTKVSGIADDPSASQAGEVLPSDWNANHTLTGTSDATQLNANVVQAVTNDTNIQGTIASQTLTFSWGGTLAAARLNANVVQGITDDTNVTGTISAQVLTLGWTGTLAAGRLNSNVVQAITNDTNITGTIATQALTLGWTGTLAAGRLNSNVVQSVVDDTNITGSIATQTLTLGWTGTLAAGRLNSNVVQSVVDDTNVTGSIAAQALTLGWTGTLANSRLANMAPNTLKGNNTGSSATPADLTGAQVEQLLLFTQSGTGAIQRNLDAKLKQDLPLSPFDFGAKGDVQGYSTTATISSGSAALTVGSGTFSGADVGKQIIIANATAYNSRIVSTISAVSSATSITLSSNSTIALSSTSAYIVYGTNDSAALQDAINYAQTSNRDIRFTAYHMCAAQLSISDTVKLTGVGHQQDSGYNYLSEVGAGNTAAYYFPLPTRGCGIVCPSSNNCISIATDHAVYFSSFGIYYPAYVVPNSGITAIQCSSASPSTGSQQIGSEFRDLLLVGGDRLLTFNQCQWFHVTDCYFYQFQTEAVTIDAAITSGNKVAGDWMFRGNTWWTDSNASAQIIGLWVKDGGWGQVVNNKFNSGGSPQGGNSSYAIFTNQTNSSTTSFEPPLIVGNSIEGWSYGVTFFESSLETATVSLATISGNQIWSNTPIFCTSQATGTVDGLPTGVWINGLIINGNNLQSQGTGNYCVSVDGAQYVVLANNFMNYTSGASSTVDYFGAHTSNVVKSGNVSNGTI